MPTKKEIASLRELLRKANAEGELLSAAEKGRQLTNLLACLESAVLLARWMAEEQPQPPIHQSARSPSWSVTEIAGSIETNEFGWLHMVLVYKCGHKKRYKVRGSAPGFPQWRPVQTPYPLKP